MRYALKTFWGNCTERDRIAIGVATILIALSTAYAYIWLPVSRERDRLLVRVPELRTETQAIERDARELERLKTVARPAIELSAAIQQAAAASHLPETAAEIVLKDSSLARVAIASARAEQALKWIARLESETGVRLESIRISSLGNGDRIRVEAVVAAR